MSRNLTKRNWFYWNDLLTRGKISNSCQLDTFVSSLVCPHLVLAWQMESPCSYQRLTCPPGLSFLSAFSSSTLSHTSLLFSPLHKTQSVASTQSSTHLTSAANIFAQLTMQQALCVLIHAFFATTLENRHYYCHSHFFKDLLIYFREKESTSRRGQREKERDKS